MNSAEPVRAYVLGSGSTGNAVLVEADGTRVLVDAGVSPRLIAARLTDLGIDAPALAVDALVATHHHGDHFAHAAGLARTFACPVYVHPGIHADALRARGPVVDYPLGRAFRIGALELSAERVPHDAPQVAVRVASRDHAFGVATDVGRVTSGLVRLLASCDAAIVEANHCPELLAFSAYPESVKRRVGGGLGHLSNERAAELATRLVGSRLARMYLGHLSRSNNTPARALETVGRAARRIEVSVIEADVPCVVDVRRGRPVQLGLQFAG